MSREEQLRDKGRLGELQGKAKDLRIRIAGLRDSIRYNCDEFAPEEDLKSESIAEQALQLFDAHTELVETLKIIANITKALSR